MRKSLAALALLFLAAHLPYLPLSLEDLDSVNFALGVQHFDVEKHRPHPPGYPVFIGMSKASTRLLRATGVAAPEVRGLAVWSAIGGAAAILFIGVFASAVTSRPLAGLLTALLTACAPLFWFTALRPLSDTIGLAAALAAVAALARALDTGVTEDAFPARARARSLVTGAFVAGLAIGLRSQTFLLTLPLLGYVMLSERRRLPPRMHVAALGALMAGGLSWLVPLVVTSGGPAGYLKALGSQGAEDFSGVVMLWTHHTPRVAAYALLNTFVLPWHSFVLGGIVLTLAAAGAVVLLRRSPRAAFVVALVFVPYGMFHLLFHEVVTVRYALPLVPAAAFLAVTALMAMNTRVAAVVVIALAAFGVARAAPASAAFARQPSPVFRLLADMNAAARDGAPPIVVMHRREMTETRRPREWVGGIIGRLLPAPRDYEWLEATRTWREDGPSAVWFIADPRRTDLAAIDARNSRTVAYRWPFPAGVYVGGARPDEMDWHVYTRPAWFLEQGWALTPEVAGVTERDGWGPHRRPSVGWIRRDVKDSVLLLGGRHLGASAEPPVRLVAELDGSPVLTAEVKAGFFLTASPVPAGMLAGNGPFARLTVRAEPVAPGVSPSRTSLEQFDLQPRGVPMLGFDEGWQEPEYNPNTARSWRWMSERAVLRIVNAAGDVTIRVAGENPRRYYSRAPVLRISGGPRELSTFRPEADFTYAIHVPAAALSAAGGRVTFESDQVFIPGDRDGSADRRHLAIRIYSVTLDR